MLWNNDDLQVSAIRVQTPMSFIVVNIYACNGKVDTHKWLRLLEQDKKNIILCSDFNAGGCQSGNIYTNKQGMLNEALMS